MPGHTKSLGYQVSLCLGICIFAVCTRAEADVVESRHPHDLPPEVAGKLRALNPIGQRGSCHESNIFIRGYHYLDRSPNEVIWFLGAPDYLCDSNSFVPVIVDRKGDWTIGTNSENSWNGSDLLDGAPLHFVHDSELGMFLTTEWQIEGPSNLMYYSRVGIVWKELRMPPQTRKSSDSGCCHAAPVESLCLAVAGDVYLAYKETEIFESRRWIAAVADAATGDPNWRLLEETPDAAVCNERRPTNFIPRVLREKTADGAIFDVSYEWAIRIPGPTK